VLPAAGTAVPLERAFFETSLRVQNPLAVALAPGAPRLERVGSMVRLVGGASDGAVFHNAAPLGAGASVVLAAGDVLRLGAVVLVYRDGAELAAPPIKRALTAVTPTGLSPLFVGPFGLAAFERDLAMLLRSTSGTVRAVALTGVTGEEGAAFAQLVGETWSPERPLVAFVAERVATADVPACLFGEEGSSGGLVALARGGTLYVDDPSALPASVVASLVKMVVERMPDVRLVLGGGGAPTRPLVPELARLVANSTLRVPRLAERREDIGAITLSCLSRLHTDVEIEAAAMEALLLRPWTGDVAELAETVRRAAGSSGKLTKTSLSQAG
jgi:transcriptional regulator of acetoin/glycerol metabolism